MRKMLASLGTITLAIVAADGARANERSRVIVEILPGEAVFDQARWRINNTLPAPPWDVVGDPDVPSNLSVADPTYVSPRPLKGGGSVQGLPDGLHIIEFLPPLNNASPCAGGAPAPMWVDVKPNATVVRSGKYTCARAVAALASRTPAEGVTVAIGPGAAVQAGAAWRLQGEQNWRGSGTTATGVTDGTHVVEFKPVSGPCSGTPPAESFDFHTGQSISLTGRYSGVGC